MEVALIGFPQSGKSTVFQALAGKADPSALFKSKGKFTPHTQIVKVPDKRLEHLAKLYKPEKVIPATVTLTDIPGFQKKDLKNEKIVSEIENYIGTVDALIHVVKRFRGEDLSETAVREMELDLIMRDFIKVENRLKRIAETWNKISGEKRRQIELEKSLLEKCLEILNKEQPLRAHSFSREENKMLSGFQFWSLKPMLILFNCDEGHYNKPVENDFLRHLNSLPRTRCMHLAGQLEMELNELPREEKEEFLTAYNLKEPGRRKVLRNIYDLLELCSFFTTREQEVRAWPIPKSTPAREAAGKIHSDMEEGFIRAEVFPYHDLIKYGNEQEIKKQGKSRTEGKEYLVQDGDIISFLFHK